MKRTVVVLVTVLALVAAACGITGTTTTTMTIDGVPPGPSASDDAGTSDLVPGAPDTTNPGTGVPEESNPRPVVETFADLGAAHLSDAEATGVINGTVGSPEYNSVPPTSGTHTPAWAQCGIYRQMIPDAVQVHSLEHGAVIIQYTPGLDPADIDALESFARDKASHVIVAAYEGLETPIVLTAWTVRLQLTNLDLDAIEEFWLDYANEGPERVPCPLEIDEAEATSA
jgi:hypothetical protein